MTPQLPTQFNDNRHLSIEAAKETLEAPKLNHNKNSLRLEIQGLRALAIAFVLLFHMWDRLFPLGFFVISGYLMCLILSRKSSITIDDSLDFYYRRLKRIVPTYVFVIFLTLISCTVLISRFEYDQIANESISALFFYSNFPSVHETEYFDFRSKFRFFLHSWSLSTELQAYLFAPMLMFMLAAFRRVHFGLSLLFLVVASAISFCRQTYAQSNAGHMSLDSRIYEFLLGFFAQYAHNSSISKFVPSFVRRSRVSSISCDYVLVIVLIFLLLLKVTASHQLQRIFVLLATTLLVAIPNGGATILKHPALVSLGDASYSIYLVHWPVFTAFRYIQPGLNKQNSNVSIKSESKCKHQSTCYSVGFLLIGLSILIGYAVEELFKRLLVGIRSWYSLLICLFFAYSVVGSVIFYMERNSLILVDRKPLSQSEEERRINDTLRLWETRNDQQPFAPNETIAYNQQIAYRDLSCSNKTRWLPAEYKNPYSIDSICNEKGNGNKTVVIVGNSHAFIPFFAIAKTFSPIAANISLMATGACTPVSMLSSLEKKKAERCDRFIQKILDLLHSWDYPIDIVITLFGFVHYGPKDDLPIKSNFQRDEMFQKFQSFYTNVSEVVREKVLIGDVNLRFHEDPLRTVQQKLLAKKEVGKIGETRKVLTAKFSNIRKRMKMVECKRCIKVNWLNLWCGPRVEDFCYAVQPTRNLALFMDTHHTTSYGAMFVGDYLMQIYKNATESTIY
ncbi:Acyltransferase [Aphelenchoides besseyi]|nr:Acyltransferase [Aphelenchoides besseyi]